MEDFPNGRLEETQKGEGQDDEKPMDFEETGDVELHSESEREIAIDENPDPVTAAHDADDSSSGSSSSDEEAGSDEKNPEPVVDSEILEGEKEILVTVFGSVEPAVPLSEEVTESIEPPVEKSGDPDLAEMDSKEMTEEIVISLEQTDVISNGAEQTTRPSLDDKRSYLAATEAIESMAVEEAILQSFSEDGVPQVEEYVASKAIEETTFQAPDEDEGSPPVATELALKAIEDTTSSYLDENNLVPPAVMDAKSKGIEEAESAAFYQSTGDSSGNGDLETKDGADYSQQVSTTIPGTELNDAVEDENKHEIPENLLSESLRQGTWRTSWRSCCGLLEILRPSSR